MNILSLFDGISCGQLALDRAGINYDNYYASEIDKYAIQITQKNYPKTIQLGSIENWKDWKLPNIDILIGGSPCQGFSQAGIGLNFDDPRSKLFFTFVDILRYYKPRWFLLENVRMKKEWKDIISSYMGVEPIQIDSALVSAQSRKRLYWTNIPNIELPEDRNILLRDILESGSADRSKAYTIDSNYWRGGETRKDFSYKKKNNLPTHNSERRLIVQVGNIYKSGGIAGRVYSPNGKSPSLRTASGGNHMPKIYTNIYPSNGQNGNVYQLDGKSPTISAGVGIRGRGIGSNNAPKVLLREEEWRKLTPVECERLQTIPDNYTNGVSNTQRYKMIGNGWTVEIIAHILKNIKE